MIRKCKRNWQVAVLIVLDTEYISEMFTDNRLHLFSAKISSLAIQYNLLVVTAALLNLLMFNSTWLRSEKHCGNTEKVHSD